MSNADQISLKKREKEKEKDEDRRIAAYLRDRELREQVIQQEKEGVKAEKERETARLRAMQEKMKDKQAELDALRAVEPETAQALLGALEPSASHGWRALRVTCSSGSDAVGILSAVCRPLAAIPLMNVSTLDANFLLVEGKHLEHALELLEPHTAVERL